MGQLSLSRVSSLLKIQYIWFILGIWTFGDAYHFYPRPVLAFGYCRCLRLSFCVSVRPSVCLCGKHLLVRAITHHPFKLGSPNLYHRCKIPWLRSLLFFWGLFFFFWGGGWLTLRSNFRSNLTSKSKVTPFWACRYDNSSPVQARITKFGPKVQNTFVKIPVDFGIDWSWSSISFSILKPFFYQTYLRCFCNYLVRPSPVYI